MTRPNIPNKKPTVASKAQEQIPQLLQQGISLWQKGLLNEAQTIFDEVLALQPKNFDALQLSAIIAGQSKNFQLALKMLDEILETKPDFADAHSNRGLALKGLKRFNEAIVSFDRAIELSPDHFQAHYNRGLSLKELKQYENALVCYERAIVLKPDYVDAHLSLGAVLVDLERLNEALACFDTAIAITPHNAEAHNIRGNILRHLKRLTEALASFDRAIAINPEYAEAHNNRGLVLYASDRLEDALTSFVLASTIESDFINAHINRSIALRDLSRLNEALESYGRVLEIKPEYVEAINDRGIILRKLKRLDEAIDNYDHVLTIKPNHTKALNNRGNALKDLKRIDESLTSFNLAIETNPEFNDAYYNKSLLLLLSGSLKKGWELYEWRWKRNDSELTPRNLPQQLWLGFEDITNKTILLHAEQGLGDTIQFCRYAKLVKERGARVLLEVPTALMELLKTLEGVDTLLEQGKPLPAFDYHCPLLSLPLAFKTELNTIPSTSTYLSAASGKLEEWTTRLGDKHKPRIGLVWSGSTGHKNDHNRSLSLSELLPSLPDGFEYFSLQKEVRATDKDVLATSDIQHYGEQLNDFTDTAALCELMDIVISVDTSVAHLAGAIGKPTLILLSYVPDWRWLLDRDDSPWYPTVKLYRQENIGDWTGALEKIKTDLITAFEVFETYELKFGSFRNFK